MFKYLLTAFILTTSPAFAASWPQEPDPHLTPGLARPLSLHDICATKWGRDARHVTAKMKRDVMEAYRFDAKACPTGRVEIDHLISRELGGADDEKNLWPQCYEVTGSSVMGAHHKDRLENALHKQVCAKSSETLLRQYQKAIARDWVGLYRQIFGAE